MPIGNRYLQGQPTLPYTNYKLLTNTDGFMDLQFVDHTKTPVTPTSISIEIDDITNSIAMLSPTTLNPSGSVSAPLIYAAFTNGVWTLQFSASLMQMSFPYIGSQLCQVGFTFTAIDSVTGQPFTGTAVAYIELCSVATVSGQNP